VARTARASAAPASASSAARGSARPPARSLRHVVAMAAVALILAACGSTPSNAMPTSTSSFLGETAGPDVLGETSSPTLGPSDTPALGPTDTPWPSPAGTATHGPLDGPTPIPPRPGVTRSIVAAGDIACDPAKNTGAPRGCDQAATAALIGSLRPTAVLALGDLQYESGTASAFQSVFGTTWGKYRSIMYPAVGNHEYLTSGAAGYFGYFKLPPYYSFNLGNWHLVSLNSECSHVGGCQAGSRQEKWLKADLAAHPTVCTLVFWHEPRWSSGEHGNAKQMTTIWSDLVAAHVDVVLAGHNHDYERFAPLDGAGKPDPKGVTEFVVGTGGKNHYGFATGPLAGEVVRDGTAFGVLRMVLGPTGYSWRFYSAAGYSFTDKGSAACVA
jgi:acid phosphatase type 7